MRHIVFILMFFITQNLFGQIKFCTYAQLDTSQYADLKLYADKKFDFYDTRNGSCWLWTKYKGDWKIIKDTIVFFWSYELIETPDTVIKQTHSEDSNVTL